MPFHVRDPETDALVRELARRRKIGLTEAIRLAVKEELRRGEDAPTFFAKVKALAEKHGRDAAEAPGKAFFDELSGS